MTPEMIVRAWKDPEFRAKVGAAGPGSPVGNASINAESLAGEAYLTSPICTDHGPKCTDVGPNCA